MLNLKEVVEILTSEGLADSKEVVIRWILDGKLKAKRTKSLNIDFSIKPTDLAAFILDLQMEKRCRQFGVNYVDWEKTFYDNQQLKVEIEELRARVRIEQSKVRGLKKMLQAEYALSDSSPLTYAALLGLEKNVSYKVISKEFRKVLKALHPDRGGDERLFKAFYEHYNNIK